MNCCVNPFTNDTLIYISVKDDKGTDLLDPTVSHSIDIQAMRLFYEIDGVSKVYMMLSS